MSAGGRRVDATIARVPTDSDELFCQAVSAWQVEPYDADALDDLLIAIVKLDQSGAVDLARGYLTARDADQRAIACQLLAVAAQLGDGQVRTTVADLALEVSSGEQDPQVLVGIVRALGGAQDERGLPVLIALAAHPDSQVRHQVAADLPMVVGEPPDPDGIAALIILSADADREIRDWATFGLGTQTDAEFATTHVALWARTADPYVAARDEAVLGLARRKDPKALPVVAELLANPSVGALIFQAAALLADPSLLPLLRAFDNTDSDVRAAIQACCRAV